MKLKFISRTSVYKPQNSTDLWASSRSYNYDMQRTFQPYFSNTKKNQGRAKFLHQRKPTVRSTVENTVKYIGVCNDPAAYHSVIRASPNSVVKTICNAALNVERGDIQLSPIQKKLFRNHRKEIAKLTNRRVNISTKRRLLEQRGGAFFIPALIGAAL